MLHLILLLLTNSMSANVYNHIIMSNVPGVGEVCVGPLTTIQHAVEGILCFKDQYTMVLKNFHYDTGGPGKLTHYYSIRLSKKSVYSIIYKVYITCFDVKTCDVRILNTCDNM